MVLWQVAVVLRLLRQVAVVLGQVGSAVVLGQVGSSSGAMLRQLASQRTSAVSTCTLVLAKQANLSTTCASDWCELASGWLWCVLTPPSVGRCEEEEAFKADDGSIEEDGSSSAGLHALLA